MFHSVIPDEIRDDASRGLQRVEGHLRLPHGFVLGLLEESDWSFVIKLNALFEDLVTAALARQMTIVVDGGFAEEFGRLKYGDVACGKLAFLQRLGSVDGSDIKFIRSLCELRNQLAHGISKLAFSFDAHVVRLDENQEKSFIQRFTSSGAFLCQQEVFGEPREAKKALAFPKEFIFCGAVDVAHVLDCMILPTEYQDALRDHVSSIFQAINEAASKSALEGLCRI